MPASRLTLVTSDRPAILVDRLAVDLAAAPLSPFDEEVIVVQSLGTERWIRHELARRHGCAAGLRMPFPAAFCYRLAASLAADDDDTGPVDDRFARDALTWRILDLIERGFAEDPAGEPLRAFVAAEPSDADGPARDAGAPERPEIHKPDTRKRLGLAARVAARFDEYQLYRPDVLLAWERGDPPGDAHERWQAALWRRLCDDARGPEGEPPRHLARWFTAAVARLEAATTAPDGLPSRLSVFGVSTLPPLFVRLLRAAARFVPVRVYVLAPPRATWSGRDAANPLFAAFGHAVRDLLPLFEGGDDVQREEHHDPPAAAHASESAPPGRAILAQLQHDLREGIHRGPEPSLAPPVGVAPDDDSLTFHVCHSALREMEVLRDQLLAALTADPTLRPHDVLVLVPDVAAYAPFVEAVFGVGEPELPRIPYRVADRPIAFESTLADAALRLLRLVGARGTAPELLELLDLDPVRRAAGLSAQAVARVRAWIEETRIRWGRDAETRQAQFGLPAVDANTWRAGLDRLLMGYAVGDEQSLIAGVLPHAGHTIGDPDALGALARWTERLFETLHDWRTPRPLGAWSRTLRDALTTFLAPDPDDADEAAALATVLAAVDDLARLEALAGGAGDSIDSPGAELDVAVVRDWLERALDDDRVGAGFLAGGMTVCAPKPMRAIPFRVIAMAGLDDGAFPRRDRRAAWDLLALAPRPGDRDLRADDRQLFLDTLCSARDRLILSWVGRSARDNKERAASVVVAELLDVVDRTLAQPAASANGERPLPRGFRGIVEHRLQPFSSAYYDGSAPRLFSYSRLNARATAVAAAGPTPPAPWVSGPLGADIRADAPLHLSLAELIDCWTNPSRFFCLRTLDLRLEGDDEPVEECEPMTVDHLTRYAVHDAILARHLAGRRDPAAEREEARARGRLPSGALARLWFDRLDAEIADFLESVGRPELEEPHALHVVGPGWTLAGRVDGVTATGRTQIRPATVQTKDLVRAWITHLALSASRGPCRTRVVGTDARKIIDLVDEPVALLDALVAGYRAALREPLPLFAQASRAWVERLVKQEEQEREGKAPRKGTLTPIDAARRAYLGSEWVPGDAGDAHVALCWRGRDPFSDAGVDFARWSESLWRPALAAIHDDVAEAAP